MVRRDIKKVEDYITWRGRLLRPGRWPGQSRGGESQASTTMQGQMSPEGRLLDARLEIGYRPLMPGQKVLDAQKPWRVWG